MRLKDKVALITGAGSGIGRASALLFTQEGAKMVVVDWDEEAGRATAEAIRSAGGQATFVRADVSRAEEVQNMIRVALEEYGRLDILFNNAGIGPVAMVTETEEEEWDQVMAINLKGVFLSAKCAIPEMIKGGGGVIINTASELGLVGSYDMHAYSASKGGVVLLTRSMAKGYAPYRVRVNCICPGPIDTPLLEEIIAAAADPEEERRSIIHDIPLKRLGRPEEIAYAALYLASDESSYLTGAALVVDGGAIA